ncbi:energy-coupling factor transporter transmembrane component T family protein [candidate division KSB1 bacterium]
MLQNLTLGHYYPGTSLLHRLDPRTKLLALIPLIISVTVNQDVSILIGLCCLTAVLVLSSGVPVRLFLTQLKTFFILIGVTILLHAVMTAGRALFTLPLIGLSVSGEGLRIGLFLGFRLLVLIVLSLILMFTTTPVGMTDGLEKLLRPLKRLGLPSDKFAMMLGISFRFIPILFEEADRIRKAQIARGAVFTGSIMSRIKNSVSVVIPLFISVFHRANSLALALEARGYGSRAERTYYADLRLKGIDCAALMVVLLVIVTVFIA